MIDISPHTRQFLTPLSSHPRDRVYVDVDDKLRYFYVRSDPGIILNRTLLFPRFFEAAKTVGGPIRVPTTDTNCLILRHAIPKGQLLFDTDEAELVVDHKCAIFERGQQASILQAKYKAGEDPDFSYRAVKELMRHQTFAARCSIDNPSYAYYMGTGTGKTMTAITRINEEASRRRHRPYRVIVACPQAITTNWRYELLDYGLVTMDITEIHGGPMKRARQILNAAMVKDKEAVICIVSYDTMWRMMNQITPVEWDLAIADEIHMCKGAKSKRTKGLLKLRDAAHSRLGLTGTPIVNGPHDLYTQFEFLGEGLSGFSTFKAFKFFYNRYKQIDDTNSVLVGVQNVPFLQERLARHAFMVSTEEALPDLPEKTYEIKSVEMTKEQKEIYRELAESIRVEIEHEMSESKNRTVTANHTLTRLLRLAQITSGFLPIDPIYDPDTGDLIEEKQIDRFDPNPKLELLIEELKAKPHTRKSIVWCCWIPDIRTIAARLGIEGISYVTFYGHTSRPDRLEAERRFNFEKEPQVLVGNPTCGGVGLNLLGQADDETDCDQHFFYSQNWSADVREQGEGRSHRKGTRVPIKITDLCVPFSIDEEIRNRVLKKRITSTKIQDVSEMLRRVTECLE